MKLCRNTCMSCLPITILTLINMIITTLASYSLSIMYSFNPSPTITTFTATWILMTVKFRYNKWGIAIYCTNIRNDPLFYHCSKDTHSKFETNRALKTKSTLSGCVRYQGIT